MATSVNPNFHSQLRSIVDVLAATAVNEISKLVDDGFAILHLEVSRSRKENEALRCTIQTMERQMASGRAENSKACEEPSVQNDGSPFKTTESVFGKQTDTSPRENTADMKDECADVKEGRTESLLIKEERLEEDSDPQGEMNSREERAVGSRAGGGERAPIQETQNKPENLTEGLTEQHRTRHGVWELTDREQQALEAFGIKEERPEGALESFEPHRELKNGFVESGSDGVGQPPSVDSPTTRCVWEVSELEATLRGPENGVAGLDSLGSEPIARDRPGRLGTLLPQWTPDPEPRDSYSTELDPESLSFSPEMRSFPATEEVPGDRLSVLYSLQWNSEVVPGACAPVEVETGMYAAWKGGATSESVRAPHRHCSEAAQKEEMQQGNVGNFCASYSQIVGRENTAASRFTGAGTAGCWPFGKSSTASKNNRMHQRIGRRGKRFSCTPFEKGFGSLKDIEFPQRVLTEEREFGCGQCGKRFAKSHDLKGHQRVHTGEKPFGCTQCDKCFTYLHQLKTHLRVHTGERPFMCTQCGKRFTQSSHIKRHQSVHTGEKRFICTLCGKRFSQSCGLKTHQAVHTGERPFSCSQCGKSFSILGNLLRHQIVHAGK